MLGKPPKRITRQPAVGRLSRLIPRNSKTQSRGGRRVKRLQVQTTHSSQLVISSRYFKTNQAKRSKLHRQLVFRVYFLPIKEVAIIKTSCRRPPKQFNLRNTAQKLKLAVNANRSGLLILFSALLGILYFGQNLHQTVALEPVAASLATSPTSSVEKVAPSQPIAHVTGLSPSEPTRLRVPSIDMDASLVKVGLQADGSLAVPGGVDRAGWYNQAPTPGEIGPAILVGHVHTPTEPAVFWRLRELQPGNVIEVDRADSKTVKFKVDAIKQFPRNALPAAEIYGSLSYPGIRLITCGGTFDRTTQTYSQSTVVFASIMLESLPEIQKSTPVGVDAAFKAPDFLKSLTIRPPIIN